MVETEEIAMEKKKGERIVYRSVGDMSEEQVERLDREKAERREPLIVEVGSRVSRSEGGETDLKLSV
ncbi:hypothetical protein LXL04_037200 [Taraxacum kok-saghyz]